MARIDAKASIFLAVDGVALSALLTARSQNGNILANLEGWRSGALTGALLLCVLAGLLTTAVVFPLLGGSRTMRKNRGTIYFGDLRRRQAGELAHQLAHLTLEDQFAQVSRQLVAMARTTWIKHRLLQVALVVALAGFLTIIGVLTFR
ncbi:hypothetical protein Ate02nite_78070 [Paractinoplanes tereljensis]|uniref:Pycsar effector protein domain-containing protein n=1 Tax=Paractinoplanes tereljensis TaxID=571912 RepID=A0A919NXB1_9ACTN|nr:hypothetical protein Ate02nite_78070 [Actinoplanes tereljensis]